MIDRSERVRRFCVSAVVGMIVLVLCVLSAVPTFVFFRGGAQGATLFTLREIDRAIESFGIVFEESARTANDLRLVHPYLFENPEKQVLDGWNRPFHFEFNGTRLIATSYGRDGQPGGIGLDAELSSDRHDFASHRPTLWQFLFDMPSGPVLLIAIISAGVAFLLTYLTVKVPKFDVRGILILVFWTVILVVVSGYFGFVMMALHYSGH